MEIYNISEQLNSFCRVFEKDLSKPQQKRFKEMMHGIIRNKKALLSEISRANRRGDTDRRVLRKQIEQYSHMLSKFPLENMMLRKMFRLKNSLTADTPIYFDFVDISKKYHKSLECIGSTWDGSEGEAARGYEIADLSIYEGKTCRSLYRHVYSTAEENYTSQVKICEGLFQQIIGIWGELRGTFVYDCGADNNRMVDLQLRYDAQFIIKLNVNRGKRDRLIRLSDEESAEKHHMMDIWGKCAQGMTVWHDAKEKKKKIVQLQWRGIEWEHQKATSPLTLVWCRREDDLRPTVFLTSRRIKNEKEAALVYHQYYARGGEEAIFKCHKDKLGMEMVRLRSFGKVKQLMYIYVLVDQFLAYLKDMALSCSELLSYYLKAFLMGEQRKITKWSIIDWYDDYWSNMERQFMIFRRRFRPPKAQLRLSLFFNPQKNGE